MRKSWRRWRLLLSAYRHIRAGTHPPSVLDGLGELARQDPQDLEVTLVTAELITWRASRADISGEPSGVELPEAIGLYDRCVPLLPPGHRDRGRAFEHYGIALKLAASDPQVPDALARSVHALREAVAATSHRDSQRPFRLFLLTGALVDHYEQSGDQEALAEAVRAGREGYAASKPGSSDRYQCRAGLIGALTPLGASAHRVEPLEEAAALEREAVAEARDFDARAEAQYSLVNTLGLLHAITQDTEVLIEAAEAADACFRATPHSHPEFRARREIAEETARDLSQATRDKEAADTRPSGPAPRDDFTDTDGADLLVDSLIEIPEIMLGHHRAFEKWENAGEEGTWEGRPGIGSVERAARNAVRFAVGNPDREVRDRSVLARILRQRSDEADGDGDVEALGEARRLFHEVLAALPRGHQKRGIHLLWLGAVLCDLAACTSNSQWLHEAREAFTECASAVVPATLRLKSFQQLAEVETALGNQSAALAAYEAAVAVLPQLPQRGMMFTTAVDHLSDTWGLPADAAAAALDAGRPERALEILEQSRGVLHRRVLDFRGLTDLRRRYPSLHGELVHLWKDVSSGNRTQEWDELLGRLRKLDGMAAFPLPRSVDDLRGHATRGPVVVVNCNGRRGDALILRAGAEHPVHVVPLPGLTQDDVIRQAQRLDDAVLGLTDETPLPARRQRQRDLHDVLGWLWDCVTAPVLEELGFTGRPESDDWPRIWWCPVGLMLHFPLHAAGHHDTQDATTVMDRVVSSYTTTVGALRTPSDEWAGPATYLRNLRAVIVAMPTTAEAPALPCAVTETETLTTLMPDATVLSGAEATRDRVLDALATHGIAHLSCHGIADFANPAASRLLLHDHLTRPLTITKIGDLALRSPELAYLSACSTSLTSLQTADEALHLTAAFQLAGYRHVIGTLWPVNEASATDISHATYARLTANGTTAPRTDDCARALHQAVRELRDRYPASPTLWAGHIHLGQ